MKMNSTLRRVLQYVKPYRMFLLCSALLAAVSVALTLYLPILSGRAIDLIVEPGRVDFLRMKPLLLRMAVSAMISALAQWLMNLCNNKVTQGTVYGIRQDAFSRLQKLPLAYLDSHATGDTLSRIVSDVDQISDGLLMGFSQLLTGVLSIAGTLGFMLSLDVPIALLVITMTPVSLFVASFIAKKIYAMFTLQSVTRGEQTAFVNEMIAAQKVVQSYGREEKTLAEFDEINTRLQTHTLRATFVSTLVNPSTRFINSLIYAGVGVLGGIRVLAGVITVGQVSSFLSYASQFAKPFNEISSVVSELQNAFASVARVFELLDAETEKPDAPQAKSPEHLEGQVELRAVEFSYSPARRLIEGLNLNVKKGQHVAIVGPTGCGKTTLINLLMRFYELDAGSIQIDGMDIREMTRGSLRAGFGMVLQDTWLKSASIRDNIAMGKPEASALEIETAAKHAHAHSFIQQLPQGYDTMVENGGENLSQGQRQLLCIARAMLALPPMLILDEATSSIDTRTELKIQSAFLRLMEGRTSFIVAHRLATVRNADVILVMRNGNIIEQGTHASLMAQDGAYRALYQSQFVL